MLSGGPVFTMPGGGWLEDADNGGNSDEGVEEGKTDRIMLDTGLNREGGGADGAVAAAGAVGASLVENDDKNEEEEEVIGPEGAEGGEEEEEFSP